MGQPLLFKVIRGGKQIAALYFNWSGYTACVYHEAKMLIDGLKARNYSADMSDEETIALLLDILENNRETFQFDKCAPSAQEIKHTEARWIIGGAGLEDMAKLDQISQKYRNKGLADPHHVSRTQGLIYISTSNMKAAEDVACSIDWLDLDGEYFTCGIFYLEPYDWFLETEQCSKERLDEVIKDLKPFDGTYAFGEAVPFTEVDKACEWVDKLLEYPSAIVGYIEDDGIREYVQIEVG